ncbi:hypothetical protein PR048_013576 [Dryococelus australis]|uniref:Uncharacterized protein n=1 Tax=Dryococelus australis TaxID=614101 RepID=A0ABQ9HTF1_9NEOP|nr:hypothetical protein PR048_013576 [Dryococelus australis]
MTTHISELKNQAFRLKILNNDIPETMLISKLLTTLPDRLIAEEKRCAASSSRDESDLLAFRTNIKKFFQCGSDRHLKTCSICKKHNHREKDCYFRKRNDMTSAVSFLTAVSVPINSEWILDSGSTCHNTNDDSVL